MKKSIILLIVMMIPLFLFGQSYSSLWFKVSEAEDKDLPQTKYEALQKIVKKAEKDKAYGHLLKAELMGAQTMALIAPDSLMPEMQRIKARYEKTTDDVLRTIYQLVLYKVGQDCNLAVQVTKPELTPALCKKMAAIKAQKYEPFVVKGIDSEIFNHDLLSVVGYELGSYKTLNGYYSSVGNRRAACITAAECYEYETSKLDSLIEVFGDLPEAGELAINKYKNLRYSHTWPMDEKMAFLHEAIERWGSWPRINYLRNEEAELTNPQYRVNYNYDVVRPQQSQEVVLKELRHVNTLTMTIYPVNAGGDIDISPSTAEGYKKIKPLLGNPVVTLERQYPDKKPYDIFGDTLTMQGLPVGVYMVEFTTNPTAETVRHLYFVTDVYVISEALPADFGTRYVVVSATTGQPIPKAHLRVRQYISYNKYEDIQAVCDEKGEYVFKTSRNYSRREVYAYTAADKACPDKNLNERYSFQKAEDVVRRTCIYTDRSIYRPGQTVHVSALVYQVKDGKDQSVSDHTSVNFTLRDANYKVVAEKKAETDAYGTCAVDFALPSKGLTGNFTIQVNEQSQRIRVEEYKRPTFEVIFPEVRQDYQAGDTIEVKAEAKSYAGVPVQGATVKYKVVRRQAFWWWSYSRYWGGGYIGSGNNDYEISEGTTKTEDDGTFTVKMPLIVPNTSYTMFYHFVVTADVTDTAGETRTGEFSLPLGNRQTALSVDLEEKILKEEAPKVTFHLRNAAGNDLDDVVRYRVDEGQWQTVKTNTPLTLIHAKSESGRHVVEAICKGDTLKREFVVFSLDDKRPAIETNDWFWQSAEQFPNDGKPVTVQVGSSDKDVHIVYTIFSENKIIQQGAVDYTNELMNLQITYEEEWGNGILLTFAWVKNGQCYTHNARITRPMPDKRLTLQWSTFRDRLTPGQKEEWSLTVKDADGKPVDARLMATMFDKSLDQLQPHQWTLTPYVSLPLPYASWKYATAHSVSSWAQYSRSSLKVVDLVFSHFDEDVFPTEYMLYRRGYRMLGRGMVMKESRLAFNEAVPMVMEEPVADDKAAEEPAETSEEEQVAEQVQMRENLNETAFFYPALTTDAAGRVVLKFTLPESLTTWRFLGVAHTADMHYGTIGAEAVAKKDVMIQPNVPRFIREGDEAAIAARIFNTSEKQINGTAILRLIDPETDKVVYEKKQAFVVGANGTTSASFPVTCADFAAQYPMLICQMMATGKGFSDGEQHYLPVLPSTDRVTVTRPITQHQPGTAVIDLAAMFPAEGNGEITNQKLTLEYTNHPAWLMVQALPTVGKPSDENAISQAAAYYANALGKFLIDHQPKAKAAFDLWRQESGNETSLMSALEKNQELKDLLLNETPWVLDADNETEQKQRLVDFFDENLMNDRLSSNIEHLRKLQQPDGSWTWWPGMSGSFYITVSISEMLVRLNALTGEQAATKQMLEKAFGFMGKEIVEVVDEMKKWKKEGHELSFPTFKALQWLYLVSLDGRSLPDEVQAANDFLMPLLKKDIKVQDLYEKAMTAVILSKTDPKRSKEYVQSLKEYTVYREDMGRYYDTKRAGYSWYDYKIPTQTMAIEAMKLITPEDQQTIIEMQRWLLQEKRTQAWDTPINSVNAVYAFMQGNSEFSPFNAPNAVIKVDEKPLALPKETAAIGYVKTVVPVDSKTLSIEKTSEGTSWGAVYAQFTQPTKFIADSGSEITVKREILKNDNSKLSPVTAPLAVGDRIVVRITIENSRDLDFVQVVDKRAACMEPVRQLSGYHYGYYCTPRDCTTNYYFDVLAKGKHVIETEYYIDRQGTYETGICTVECAYAPEFRAITKSQSLKVK